MNKIINSVKENIFIYAAIAAIIFGILVISKIVVNKNYKSSTTEITCFAGGVVFKFSKEQDQWRREGRVIIVKEGKAELTFPDIACLTMEVRR